MASAPGIPDRVVRWDGQRLHIEARSTGDAIDPAYLAHLQPISWRAPDGMEVYGLYAPPTNPRYTSQGLPPAIVYFHGGPTSASWVRFSRRGILFHHRAGTAGWR